MNRPLKRRWNLLLTPPLDAITNMAIDAYLFRSHAVGEAPTLRLYSWQFPSISIGISHRLDSSLLWKYRGWSFVRRMTGGGMVFHGKDLTYSVVFDAEQPWIPYRVKESYHFFHALVAEALSRIGMAAEFSPGNGKPRGAPCFQEAVCGDLLFQGRKIAGAAQKRGGRRALHQGSIQIGELVKNKGMERLQHRLVEVFQEKLGISFMLQSLSHVKEGGEDDRTWSRTFASVGGGRVLGS